MTGVKIYRIKSIFVLLIFIFSFQSIFAQEYYKPLNIQKAYQNKTRSAHGQPGKNYWQNHSDYTINAKLNTEEDILSGEAEIKYYNESPDTLKQIILRVYQDFFRHGNARQWPVPLTDLNDGVQITRLIIDGNEFDHENDFPNRYITNMPFRLKQPLAPGKSLTIEIEWNFEIPSTRGLRMRKYDYGHYFIAYWYPQIAVYDDIDGWDRVEYLGMVEFYNDFNNYDVKITVPEKHMVWATGDLQNADKILKPAILERYTKAIDSDDVTQIISLSDLKDDQVFAEKGDQTFYFKATEVPDISFAVSNHSSWDAVGLTVDSTKNRRILCSAVYPEEAKHWEEAAEISRTSITYMSFELPGVPFPYLQMTSFCNGARSGGMETPMMANNGIATSYESLVGLLFHEISHNYFPFYMGTNERKYAFMDEGWAAYLPHDVIEGYRSGYNYMKREVEGYVSLAGQEEELPLMIPTYNHNNYASARVAAYNRPAVAYHMLRLSMGETLFHKAIQEYMKRWNGKHPLPYDFIFTIEDVSGESYEWFFQEWFFASGYPDLAIKEVKDRNIIVIEKIGSFPVPLNIEWTSSDGAQGNVYESPAIWKDGKTTHSILLAEDIKLENIKLGRDDIPDVNPSNNLWEK
jgi:hypothetical protein